MSGLPDACVSIHDVLLYENLHCFIEMQHLIVCSTLGTKLTPSLPRCLLLCMHAFAMRVFDMPTPFLTVHRRCDGELPLFLQATHQYMAVSHAKQQQKAV